MPDVVGVTTAEPLHDELGVKQDEATEEEEAKVDVKLRGGARK